MPLFTNRKKDTDEQLPVQSKVVVSKKTQGPGVRTRQMTKCDEIENIRADEDSFYLSDSCCETISTPVKCNTSMSANSIDLNSSELDQSLVSNTNSQGPMEPTADYCLQTPIHVEREDSVADEGDGATETDPEKIKTTIRQKPPDKLTKQDLLEYMNNMFVSTRQDLKDHMDTVFQ